MSDGSHRPGLLRLVLPIGGPGEAPLDAGDEGERARIIELVRGLRAGERAAQSELWARFAPMVLRMATRMLRPGCDVDDLVQDVFAAVFRDVRQLREPAALKGFVGAIAANQIKRELGRRRIRRWFERKSDSSVEEASRGPSSSATFALRRLYSILDGFRPTDRMVFVLREIEGHSVDEVAALLGVSRATVKRKSAHVHARLARHLRNDPFLVDYLPTVSGEHNE